MSCVQDKLWACLQALLPRHDLSCTIINQAILAALAELKSMSSAHHEHIAEMSARFRAELSDFAPGREAGDRASNGFKRNPTVEHVCKPVVKVIRKEKKRIERKKLGRKASDTQMADVRLGALPELKRMLEMPPNFSLSTRQGWTPNGDGPAVGNKSSADGGSQEEAQPLIVVKEECASRIISETVRQNIRESHKEVASLLEAPSSVPTVGLSLQYQPTQLPPPITTMTPSVVAISRSDSDEAKMEVTDGEDEPLNLCVRENGGVSGASK